MLKKCTNFKRIGCFLIAVLFGVTTLAVTPVQKANAADEYDGLRNKWKTMLTGGTSYNTSDSDIAAKISLITSTAQDNWDTMNKSAGRTYLWSDVASTTISADVTKSYNKIKAMAIAYNTTGSSLKGNTTLKTDIINALDWMDTNRFTGGATYDNWWDWVVGAPLELNDCVVLMYDVLSTTQISNYMSSEAAYGPYKYSVVSLYGVITKNSPKIQDAKNTISSLCVNVTSGNFFYEDGTYIQHENHPYNLGYGTGDLRDIGDLVYLFNGSTWSVSASDKQVMVDRVFKGFEPLIYKGVAMDMVRGREISRYDNQDYIASVLAISSIARVSKFASTSDAAKMKSMIKYWKNESIANFYASLESLDIMVYIKAIMSDSSVVSRGELVKYKQYPSMDRAVQLRPGFGFGISMHSTRIANAEMDVNQENLKAWHTGDGMTYLYNSDKTQFSGNFWPTVNNYRLPGTTVLQSTASAGDKKSDRSWVGGSSLQDTYGTTGMDFHAYGYNLQAKKSWFMFDNEIVALGAGISSTDNKVVETIAENRKLNSSGNNAFTVNGTEKSTAIGWSESMTGVNWAHLAGNVAGSDIGYYFPNGASVKGLRESRTANWNSLNTNPSRPNPTNYTNRFLTMWFDHGTNPTAGTYSYVLLPGMTSSQVSSYATNSQITVLKNDANVQAVKEKGLNIIGVNFWTDSVQTADIIKSNKKASVMTKETANDIEITVSDPTQLNTGTIAIEISKNVSSVISKDSQVTVDNASLGTSTLKFTVNVSGAEGKTFKAKFELASGGSATIIDNNNANITYSGTWSHSSDANYYNSTKSVSRTTGSYAQYSFNGTAVEVYGKKGAVLGKFDVYIDNVYSATVDCYNATDLNQEQLYTKQGLSSGNHTVKILLAGQKNSSSGNYYVGLDYFQYVN